MKYVFCLLTVLFLGCAPETNCCTNLDVGMQFAVLDANGNDVLNPSNPNAFKAQNIKIYYVIDGVSEYQNSGNGGLLEISKYQNHENYIISIGPYVGDHLSTTLIKWNEIDIDTIKCEVERISSNTRISKVWFNDVLKWDGVNERYFEVVK